MKVLNDLREGRMVGVISHVAELKRQIDTRSEVAEAETGSKVTLTVGEWSCPRLAGSQSSLLPWPGLFMRIYCEPELHCISACCGRTPTLTGSNTPAPDNLPQQPDLQHTTSSRYEAHE